MRFVCRTSGASLSWSLYFFASLEVPGLGALSSFSTWGKNRKKQCQSPLFLFISCLFVCLTVFWCLFGLQMQRSACQASPSSASSATLDISGQSFMVSFFFRTMDGSGNQIKKYSLWARQQATKHVFALVRLFLWLWVVTFRPSKPKKRCKKQSSKWAAMARQLVFHLFFLLRGPLATVATCLLREIGRIFTFNKHKFQKASHTEYGSNPTQHRQHLAFSYLFLTHERQAPLLRCLLLSTSLSQLRHDAWRYWSQLKGFWDKKRAAEMADRAMSIAWVIQLGAIMVSSSQSFFDSLEPVFRAFPGALTHKRQDWDSRLPEAAYLLRFYMRHWWYLIFR